MNEQRKTLKELDNRVYEIIESASDKERAKQALDYYLNGNGNVFSLMELALSEAINGNYENYLTLRDALNLDCSANGFEHYSLLSFCVSTGLFHHLYCQKNKAHKGRKHLYVILLDNGSVKIGIASDVRRRYSQIKSASGMNVLKHWESELIEDAYKLETELHRKYKSYRLKGEYFDIDYEEAVIQAKQIALIGG